MTKKLIIGLLCSTFFSTLAFAGLEDGVKAFQGVSRLVTHKIPKEIIHKELGSIKMF